jgi:hypothetical protein
MDSSGQLVFQSGKKGSSSPWDQLCRDPEGWVCPFNDSLTFFGRGVCINKRLVHTFCRAHSRKPELQTLRHALKTRK